MVIKKDINEFIALTNNNRVFEFNFDNENNKVKINKNTANIHIEKGTDGFDYIVFDKHKYPFEILNQTDNKYTILINGVSYNISIETPFSYERKKIIEQNREKQKNEIFKAPMPGKIVDIFVNENDEITEGDSLFVLEAMKMQNEVLSNVTGKIKKIHIKVGENIMKDDVLIEVDL